MKARIIGMGSHLPEKVLSNADLEKMVDTSDEWITSRTGIKERRIAAADEYTSDMAVKAAEKALNDCKLDKSKIDFIIVATVTPDYITPSTAAIVQAKLGADKIPSMDVSAACTGFIYALSTAKAFIESGIYKNVLVIASEKLSMAVNYKDRNTCVLFGDGASAAIVSSEGKGLLLDGFCLGADGEVAELLSIPGGGSRFPTTQETVAADLHYWQMDGKEVFKHAVRRMSNAVKECLEKLNLKEEQISWLVPHQANLRIIDAIAKNFTLPEEKVYKTLHKYGNTSASSVPIALEELIHSKDIQEGEHILLVAFGAGLTWGAGILKKVDA